MTWGGGPIRSVPVTIPVQGLSSRRVIDFISDIHLRNAAALEEFKASVRTPASDLLLLGGDYAERDTLLEPLFMHLAAIWPRILAVRGNNDAPFQETLDRVTARLGVRVLDDEVVEEGGLHILGTRDPQRDTPRLPALPGPPLLVLSHSPDILLDLPSDRPATVLAGHVHGGQIRVPGWPWWWSHTRIGRAHGEGRSRRGEVELFVGRGIGCSLVDIRNVPREVYVVTLVPGQGTSPSGGGAS